MHYLTHSHLVRDFRALGIKAGDTLMLHASVKAMGWVVGGPDVVLRALLEVLTLEGTLMMGLGWLDAPYDIDTWEDEAKKAAYLDEMPAFDPRTSRADHGDMSILAEYLRTFPGAMRSEKPFSYAAVGKQAAYSTADQPHNYRDGAGSPLEKLCHLNGKVLMLGAPLNTVTLLHYAENLAQVANKRVVRYRFPVLKNGVRVWELFEEFDTSNGIVDWIGETEDEDYFATITTAYLQANAISAYQVGAAESYVLDANALVRFGVAWMEQNLNPSTPNNQTL
jgi:aminoglycoside 3-N-acetyltransferase